MWVVVAVVLAILGGAAVVMGKTPPAVDDTPAIHAAATRLASAIDSTRDAAQRRAKTLADTPLLRAGIETDVATIEDLATNESLFSSTRAEQIEVFQLQDRTLMPVLHFPATTAELDASTDETTTFLPGKNTVLIAATAPIAKQSGGTGGAITVAVPSDLRTVETDLARYAKSAQLTGLDQAVPLFAGPAGDRSLTVPVGDTKLSLVVTIETAPAVAGALASARFPLWGAGVVALLVYVALGARASRRRRALLA